MEPAYAQKDEEKKARMEDTAREATKKHETAGALEKFIKRRRTIEVLQKKGIKYLFPIQYETFKIIYDKYDLIARDRTGSGKTIAFALPVIQRFRDKDLFGDRTTKFLVVLPTRELTNQVYQEISSLKHSDSEFYVIPVYGGTNIHDQIRDIKRGADIIVATPGRLLDLLERQVIKLDNLRVVCLDEADEMLRIGFQEDIEKIFKFIKKHTDKYTQNMLFSATIPEWVVDLSKKYLNPEKKFIDLIKDSDYKTPKTIQHLSIKCRSRHREDAIGDIIEFYGRQDGRTIVFTQTKRQANDIGSRTILGQQVEVLHGDIPQRKRQYVFKNFKEGRIRCIVATNVAARGLDIPQVDLVVQLEPPKDIETYIHRAGRTGRAGRNGICVTFYTDDQDRLLSRIEQVAKIRFKDVDLPSKHEVEKARQAAKQAKQNGHTNGHTNGHSGSKSHNDRHSDNKNHSDDRGHRHTDRNEGNEKSESDKRPQTNSGYFMCRLKAPHEMHSLTLVYNFLSSQLPQTTIEVIRNMKKIDERTVDFQVPDANKFQMLRLANLIKTDSSPEGYELKIINEETEAKAVQIPKINTEVKEIQLREAHKNKVDLQVQISGLSSSITQKEILSCLNQKNISMASLHLSKNDTKTVAYGLCLDERSLLNILKLNGQNLLGSIISVRKPINY